MLNGIIQIYTFPQLLRRFGPKRLYIASFAFFFVAFATYPVMGYMAKQRMEAGMWCILGRVVLSHVLQLW
jgi:hypothetical protein